MIRQNYTIKNNRKSIAVAAGPGSPRLGQGLCHQGSKDWLYTVKVWIKTITFAWNYVQLRNLHKLFWFNPYCRWNRWLWKTLMASCPPMSTARCLSTPSWQPLQWWSFSFGPCYVFDGGRSCSTSTWPSAACASSPSLKVWRGSCTFSAGMKEVWRVRPCFLDDDLWFSHFYNKLTTCEVYWPLLCWCFLPIHPPTRSEVQRFNLPVGLQEHPVIHAHFVRMFGLGRHQAAPWWGHHLPNGFSFNRLHLLECGAGGGIRGWLFVQQKQNHMFFWTLMVLALFTIFWTRAMIAPRMVGLMSSRPELRSGRLGWGPWCRWSWPTGIPNPCPCPLWSYACCRSHVWTVPGAASEFRSSDWFESNRIETWKKARGIEPRSNATKYIFCFQRFDFLFFWVSTTCLLDGGYDHNWSSQNKGNFGSSSFVRGIQV